MKKMKYLTQDQVEKIATHKIASIGSCSAPIKKVYGTITTNSVGQRYNTATVSIMLYTPDFWNYWATRAKQLNVFFELFADKEV
jgi:hypothetical protein